MKTDNLRKATIAQFKRPVLCLMMLAACVAGATAQSGDYCANFVYSYGPDFYSIANVTLNSIDQNNSSGIHTKDFTYDSTDLTKGNTYTMSVTAAGVYINVYIDYDQDQDWNTTDEWVAQNVYVDGTSQLTFTVPQTALTGATRLRVLSDGHPQTGPCYTYNGETQDYTVVITPGNCLAFDGINDYVSIPPTNIDNQFGANQITVEGWFYLSGASSGAQYPMLVGESIVNDGNVEFAIWEDIPNGKIDAGFYYAGNFYNTQYAMPPTNQWVHIAATYDQTAVKLYYNGVLMASNAYTAALPLGLNEWRIGARWDATPVEFINGKFDEIRIWNVAKTATDIQDNMVCELTGIEPGLVAYYNFNEGAPGGNNTGITTLTDLTTNGNNGTLNNFALTGSTSNWIAGQAYNCVKTWTGATSTDWNTATNWSPAVVPNSGTDVIIPNTTNQPVISSNDTIYDITIASGATVTVAAGGTLTLNGTLLNSGAFTVQNGGGFLQGTGSSYSGTGTFNVQNKILNTSDGYRDLSSPVATTVADLANDFPVFGTNGVDCWYNYSPYPNVQVYNEALNNVGTANGNYYAGWVSYTGSTNPLSPMLGVAVRNYPGGNPYTITLTGTPYNGAQTVAITNTPSGTSSQDGWNFVGNPYPSNIDWTAVAALNGNITGAYYVFHTTGEYSGNWGTCNASGVCTGINGMNQYISPMQGFFVNAPSSGTFYMDNTVRTTSASGGFYAHGPLENEVRLKLSDDVNSDEIVSYTNPAATNGNDNGLDAEKIAAGSTVYMSYKLEGIEYAINVVNTITAQTELPLIISVADTGNYTLSAVALNVPGLTAYLKDTLHNTVTDLSTGNVTLSLNGGQVYGNYEVVFKAVPVSGVANVAESATTIYSYINHVTVERPTTDAATITVTNILGQQIATLESESNKTEFDLPAPSPWYAIVKVTEGEKVTVSKVFISK